MPSIFIRVILFFSSYFPLILIFCILLAGRQPWWMVGALLGVGIAILLFMGFYFRVERHSLPREHQKVTHFARRDTDVLSYIASYLIPFVAFPLDTLQQLAALIVFILVLLVVYVHSNMIYINPMLNLAGYHLYEVEIENSTQPHYFIARKRIVLNEEIFFVRLSDDIFLEK